MEDETLTFNALLAAAERGDIGAISAQVATGFDVHTTNAHGESVLSMLLSNLVTDEENPASHRYEVVRALLALGFDPNQLDPERAGALTEAMLGRDAQMLRLLLEAGARPNDVSEFFPEDTLFDWAMIDYLFETWNINETPFAELTDSDNASVDQWLAWIDRMAVKHHRRRPDCLLVLREHGARTRVELAAPPEHHDSRAAPLQVSLRPE